ncbi:hypothetical protein STCU_10043 [Strigomonas culicis]|uniref:Proteophosphoglycan ppg4 n=1 Tax=Strigomonas culicis TaxID=28005 RepID=S9TNT8_9TRYP|nr:hypothetical protein STCU_10043 [Strigomonas culicis]|eukprot:EPY18374.1 hypothetical protein STCU_10043 [Strigomonas culicis]
MSLFTVNRAIDVSKSGTECRLTDTSQGNSYIGSGSSYETNFFADTVEPAEEESPPCLFLCDWPSFLLETEMDAQTHSSAPLGVDGAGAAPADDVYPLPVGARTPNIAAAQRQKRLSLARTGEAVSTAPCSLTGGALPLRGGASRLNSRIDSYRNMAYRNANRRVSSVGLEGGARRDPLAGRSRGSSVAAAGARGGRLRVSAACGQLLRSGSLTGRVARLAAQPAAAAPRLLLTPDAVYKFPAEASSPDSSMCSDATTDSSACARVEGKEAAKRLKRCNELNQRPGVPLTLPVFNHGCSTALEQYRLQWDSSTSESTMSDSASTTSCSVNPPRAGAITTTMPYSEKSDGANLEGPIACMLSPVRDSRQVEQTEAKQKSPFSREAAGGQGLRRTHSLFPGNFTAIAKEMDHEPTGAAPDPMSQSPSELDTSGPILCDSSSFIPSSAVPRGVTADRTRGPNGKQTDEKRQERAYRTGRDYHSSTDSGSEAEEAQAYGGGKGRRFAVVDGLRSVQSFLRHFCSMRADPAPQRSAAKKTPTQQGCPFTRGEPRYPLLPVADPPRQAAVPDALLPSDAARKQPAAVSTTSSRTLPKATTALAMRYRFPQPEMSGPPLPELPKVDPQLLFGGDWLSTAAWVSSPRDVDLDSDEVEVLRWSHRRRRNAEVEC